MILSLFDTNFPWGFITRNICSGEKKSLYGEFKKILKKIFVDRYEISSKTDFLR